MTEPLCGEDPEPAERFPAGPMFVPVRPGPAGCTARLFPTPLGERTAVGFTSERRLTATLGRGQAWIRLAEPALRALVEPLGVTRLTVDPPALGAVARPGGGRRTPLMRARPGSAGRRSAAGDRRGRARLGARPVDRWRGSRTMTTVHDPAVATPSDELSVWPASATEPRRGDLTVGGVPLAEVADRFGTPVHVLDEGEVHDRCRTYRDAFPDAEVLYAAKAFLCRAMVHWMDEEGLGLDVCSAGELELAVTTGFPAERIVLPATPRHRATWSPAGRSPDRPVSRCTTSSPSNTPAGTPSSPWTAA